MNCCQLAFVLGLMYYGLPYILKVPWLQEIVDKHEEQIKKHEEDLCHQLDDLFLAAFPQGTFPPMPSPIPEMSTTEASTWTHWTWEHDSAFVPRRAMATQTTTRIFDHKSLRSEETTCGSVTTQWITQPILRVEGDVEGKPNRLDVLQIAIRHKHMNKISDLPDGWMANVPHLQKAFEQHLGKAFRFRMHDVNLHDRNEVFCLIEAVATSGPFPESSAVTQRKVDIFLFRDLFIPHSVWDDEYDRQPSWHEHGSTMMMMMAITAPVTTPDSVVSDHGADPSVSDSLKVEKEEL